MRPIPQEFEIYRHFKGNNYQIVAIATHSETREEMVVYRALYGDGKIYVRPLEMFMSEVDHDKYPEVTQVYRFEKEELAADPGVLEFLAAETFEERIGVLKRLEARITNPMIDTMAMSLDIEIKDGDVIRRYNDFLGALELNRKYETDRFRK
ncbi:MAG: DUF1653 domain-containing protein [Lachnospiraceae bacterium]|nr:DUF1653 domain-containing protein [Lachnospiraceae bacterium]